MSALAFDIETYGAWGDLPARVRSYLEQRDRDRGVAPEDPRASPRTVSLLPGAARVVAIGLWETGDERQVAPAQGEALALDPGQAEDERRAQLPCGGEARFFREEAALLRAFWERAGHVAGGGGRLVSFHGRGFDGPMLLVRSAVLGVVPSVNLAGRSRSLRPHCDLGEALSFFGATRQSLSLDYWCGVFGVPSPKANGLTGREVGGAFERGEHAAIAAYALGDARATAALYARLEASFLELIEETDPTASAIGSR